MVNARIRIPEAIAASVLVASDHTCCKCEERGAPVQIHHIDDNPTNNDPTNLAVLCLICHNETQVAGGFARQLTPSAVRLYRDNWVARVSKRRSEADAFFVNRATRCDEGKRSPATLPNEIPPAKLSDAELELYIENLPDILNSAYEKTSDDWDSNTVGMVRAAYEVTEVVRRIWLQLAALFPEGHFDGITPEEYLEEFLGRRYSWQRAMAEPYGPGTGGTIAGVLVARGALHDLETSVVDIRNALKGLGESVRDYDAWMERWKAAKNKRSRRDPTNSHHHATAAALASQTIDDKRNEDSAKLEALARTSEFFDLVAYGKTVRIMVTQLINTTGGQTNYALSCKIGNSDERIFDKIEGHHFHLFDEDLDGDGVPEIIAQFHCGAHTMGMRVYRLSNADATPELIPGADIGSDWPEIRWEKREDGKGFAISVKHRNWTGSPTQEFVIERYAFENGECVKLPSLQDGQGG